MGTIDGKKLKDALAKAKNVGFVEETFSIEDCEVTLRNLRPDEYTAAIQDCQGLGDVEYLHMYQRGQISRSIVALNGIDFRGIDFVEDEEPDPKKPDRMRSIKLELHAYLFKNVIATWGKEAIYTAYRKFVDVVEKAERQAKEGITFLTPEETEEEKYRRLLLEAKECEDNLPSTLVDRVLDDLGLMRKTTAEEAKASMEKLDELRREQEAAAAQADAASEPVAPEELPPAPVVSEPVATRVAEPHRQPLNAPPGRLPTDPHQTLQQAIAARQQPVSAPPTPVVTANQPGLGEVQPSSRAARIAEIESAALAMPATLPGPQGPIAVYQPEQPPEAVELRQRQDPFDPEAAAKILDTQPSKGINPRFQPRRQV